VLATCTNAPNAEPRSCTESCRNGFPTSTSSTLASLSRSRELVWFRQWWVLACLRVHVQNKNRTYITFRTIKGVSSRDPRMRQIVRKEGTVNTARNSYHGCVLRTAQLNDDCTRPHPTTVTAAPHYPHTRPPDVPARLVYQRLLVNTYCFSGLCRPRGRARPPSAYRCP
jgi:hypothetical protein